MLRQGDEACSTSMHANSVLDSRFAYRREAREESRMESIALPELYCPFEPEMSPYADEAYEGTLEWAHRFGLAGEDSPFRVDLGRVAGFYHPYACDPRVLRLISDVCAWFFMRDDWLDESEVGESPQRLAAWNRRFMEVLEGDEPTGQDEPLTVALWDLHKRLLSESPSTHWTRRFLRSVREHLDAALWECTNRRAGTLPDPEAYIRMRRQTGGVYIDSDLMEIADRIHLSPEVFHHPAVRALRDASGNILCWSNDLLSLEKELRSGEVVHNLVFVVQRAYGISIEDAVARVAKMHDAEMRLFVEQEQRLPVFGGQMDEELDRYVRALRARLGGNQYWIYEAVRYQLGALATRPGLVEAEEVLAV